MMAMSQVEADPFTIADIVFAACSHDNQVLHWISISRELVGQQLSA